VVENKRKFNPINTGLPNHGEPVFLAVGILRKPHGIKGEVLMQLLTDFPERITKGKKIYLGESYDQVLINSARNSNTGLLVHLENVESREAAEKLCNNIVYVRCDEIPNLPKGSFYHNQIIGLIVYKVDKTRLGVIVEIISTGSNDVYIIKPDDEIEKELLLPAISSVILETDLKKGIMIVDPPVWG
jgi:16S rRNA processing protein RimM